MLDHSINYHQCELLKSTKFEIVNRKRSFCGCCFDTVYLKIVVLAFKILKIDKNLQYIKFNFLNLLINFLMIKKLKIFICFVFKQRKNYFEYYIE